ncbi:MAG: phosphoglycolate phosphatase [Acetobacteraceae bacterium]|nr:phosphoglycolate phosphatase [Acetobacteraceae bacterium]
MARSLLLDLDGTLVDTVPDLAAVLNRLMHARGLPEFNRNQVASMVGDGVGVLVARAFNARGQPPDSTAVAEFSADYEANIAVKSTLYPHVSQALEALARDGWRLAVCTNKPERAARALLKALGLLPLMSAVGGGDSFPVRKPDPGHLRATLLLAMGTLDQAVALGDHRNDVLAAAGAGIPCIFAGWGYGSPGMPEGCTAIANDILEAVQIANRLLPAE